MGSSPLITLFNYPNGYALPCLSESETTVRCPLRSAWLRLTFCTLYRRTVVPNDYSGQLTHLLRYPSHTPIPTSGSSSSMSLLLTQAQMLQGAPHPASGATVAMQNRDAFGIPMEVPDSPTPPRRSRPDRDRDRRPQSTSTVGGLHRRRSPQLAGGGVQAYANTLTTRIGSYADQYRKDQFGLPEMLSKRLSDINGVVSNTVSEIRVRGFSAIVLSN
jgi:TBC1 domain family protein 5